MNKAELIDQLTERLESDRRSATDAVEHIVDIIVRAVHAGENVTITGFGVFEQRRRAARVARNPRTGETVKVKPTSVPAFRPGAQFKAVIAGKQKLPATGPAVKRGSAAAAPVKKAAAKKTAAKKAAPAKKTVAKATPAKKAAPAKKATATKATTATRATAAKKTTPAKKTTATKATAAKKTTPAKKTTATKATAAKKTTPAKKAAPAKKTVAKKAAPAKKAPAKKAPARKR
ncbi:HU family DNA-binding protein [Rhodococcus sp. NPDC003318]|uniref:HU family DNA-binding protein n=1 Tax=Rhodococcus sp. NPDC003318 TaxID=3364503 RepID=UPI0036918A8E